MSSDNGEPDTKWYQLLDSPIVANDQHAAEPFMRQGKNMNMKSPSSRGISQ
jgi:hypothetical protein